MDRLEEIRQRCEAAKAQKEKGDRVTATCIAWSIVTNDIPYLLSEVDRLTALHKREIIVTGEYAQCVIDFIARAEAAEAERDAAVEDLKQHILWNGTACTYCRYCEEAESALSPCDTCEDIPDTKMPTNWEWRGRKEQENG